MRKGEPIGGGYVPEDTFRYMRGVSPGPQVDPPGFKFSDRTIIVEYSDTLTFWLLDGKLYVYTRNRK